MDTLKFFDAYSIRARLFPAIIATAPAFAALALLISWETLRLSNVIASLGVLVLLFAIADFARGRGRSIEKKLYQKHGGIPSIIMFRRNDNSIDEGSKERYRRFLAAKLQIVAPSSKEEAEDQDKTDAFYDQCGVWLRQNTRDTKQFSILFGENVAYGFRRNLLGLKTFALWINAIVVVVCISILCHLLWDFSTQLANNIILVLIVAAAHATYMLLAVNSNTVWHASRAYGRELILSCESFLAEMNTPNKENPAHKRTSELEDENT